MGKIFAITLFSVLSLLFQGCGKVTALQMSSSGPLTLSCQTETPEIQHHFTNNTLEFSLETPNRNQLPSIWKATTETGHTIVETNVPSDQGLAIHLAGIEACELKVTAFFPDCDDTFSSQVQKTIQLKACTTLPHTTTTTTVPRNTTPVTTTTTIPNFPTTTTAPAPQSGIEAPGCRASSTQSIFWTNVFGGWPKYGSSRRFFIDSGQTISLIFVPTAPSSVAPVNPGYGTFATATFPFDGDGDLKMVISQTPGCVDETKIDPRCVVTDRFASIGWSTRGDNSLFSCPLQAGQTYYLNLTYGSLSAPAPGQAFCPEARCGFDFQNQVQ